MIRVILLCCISLFAVATSSVFAYTLVPSIGINVETHSNVKKAEASEVEDTIIKPYFGFEIADQTDLFLIDMDVRLEQERYQDKTYADTETPDINAYLGWKILPARLLWSIEDSATRKLIDAKASATPDNSQNINVFSTGPDILFATDAWKAVVKLRYNDASFSESANDSTALTSSLFLNRELNSYSRLGGVFYHQDTDYDSSLNDDYKLSQMYFLYDRDMPFGDFQLKLGSNSLSNELDDKTEPYGLVRLRYYSASSLTAGASYRTRFSDPGANLSTPAITTLENMEVGQISSGLISSSTADPYHQDDFNLYIAYAAGMYYSKFNYFTESNDYFGQQDQRDMEGVAIDLGVRLSSGLGLSFVAWRTQSEFIESYIDETTDNFSLKLDYKLANGLFLNLGVGRELKDSSDPTREYEDEIVFAGIGYRGEERE